MDIFASIFVYLASVTGIVAALAASIFVVCSTPEQPTTVKFPVTNMSLAGVAPISAKTVMAAEPSSEPPVLQAAPGVAKADGLAQTAGASFDLKIRPTVRAHLRRLAQKERAKRLAYQPDPSFEARFMSYAD
jgi:hypothetical protein